MNNSQVNWASKHDWYVDHGVSAQGQVFVRVQECYTVGGVLQDEDRKEFTDYQELREWAGY